MSREEWLEWRHAWSDGLAERKPTTREEWERLPLVERLNRARTGGLPPEKKRDTLEILENSQPVDVRTIELEKSLNQMTSSRDYWRHNYKCLKKEMMRKSNLDSDAPFK